MLSVLDLYAKTLGLKRLNGESDDDFATRMMEYLRQNDNLSQIDEVLLTERPELAEDAVLRRWLENGREPVEIQVKVTISFEQVFLANLTRNKGGAEDFVAQQYEDAQPGNVICSMMRDAGFSFNETLPALKRFGAYSKMIGDQPGCMLPVIYVAPLPVQPKPKRNAVMQELAGLVYMFVEDKPDDHWLKKWALQYAPTYPDYPAVRWEVPLERIEELELPVLDVYIPTGVENA